MIVVKNQQCLKGKCVYIDENYLPHGIFDSLIDGAYKTLEVSIKHVECSKLVKCTSLKEWVIACV